MKTNAINWFEIYVNDFAKAKSFYETILGINLEVSENNGITMGMFPCDYEKGIGGCISKMDCCSAGTGGTLVYLNAEGEIDAIAARVPDAGGKIIRERFAIPPHGYIAIIEDAEGNTVGLHSMS